MDLMIVILSIIVLALSFPLGIYIAKACNDELVSGRKWFKLLILISSIGFIISLLFTISYLWLTFLFISIVSIISLVKSYNKNK